MFTTIYISISVIIMAISLVLTILVFLKKDKTSATMGELFITSILVSVFYILSVYIKNDTLRSLTSSFYFLCIDLLVMSMFMFTIIYTETKNRKLLRPIAITITVWFLAEVVIYILNPFLGEFAVSFEENREIIEGITVYSYQMKPLFIVHLVYTYSILAVSFVLLIYKSIKVPHEYKNKYIAIILCMVGTIIYNAIFLFLPKEAWNALDYSILGYCISDIAIFWCTFYYSRKILLDKFKSTIFESIEQGLLLFDYNGDILLYNEKANLLLKNIEINNKLKLDEFISKLNLKLPNELDSDTYSLQCNINYNNEIHPLRFDYKRIKNKKGQLIALLFTVVNAELEIDLLTGYHSWDSFKKLNVEHPNYYDYPNGVAIIDINALSTYNEAYGYNAGNELIKKLADRVKDIFSNDCYYIRGKDASLIVLYNYDDNEALEKLNILRDEAIAIIQYSFLSINGDKYILDGIKECFEGLKAKKLLDKSSTSSKVLAALVKSLQQCDADTESHVKRTQAIGAKLGKKLNLSDVDLSNLSLLCILHDIGKIGVPLDILNKPGKLTKDEWEIIKSHAEKGYNIAKSSSDLEGIALMVKYHHERWDGKGYPDGLSMESIPLLSRIISVVDAFDAMVSDRSYRKALPLETAKNEIKKNAGTQFDPHIASTFLELIEEEKLYSNAEKTTQKEEAIITNKTIDAYKNEHIDSVNYSKYIINSSGKIIEIDDNFTKITGYTKEEAFNISQYNLIPEEDRTDYFILVEEQLNIKQMAYFEHRLLCKDGSIINVLCVGKNIYDSASKQMKSEIIIADSLKTRTSELLKEKIEEKVRIRKEEWEKIYRSDSLTGLLTHQAFKNDIETLLLANKKILFFMMDLDKFKTFNDTFGHYAGDEYLIYVSKVIKEAVGEDGLCCRMGGDEFAFALIDKDNLEENADIIFKTINTKMNEFDNATSFSMGCCESSDEINKFDKLYEKADIALYRAKDLGRNQYSI